MAQFLSAHVVQAEQDQYSIDHERFRNFLDLPNNTDSGHQRGYGDQDAKCLLLRKPNSQQLVMDVISPTLERRFMRSNAPNHN